TNAGMHGLWQYAVLVALGEIALEASRILCHYGPHGAIADRKFTWPFSTTTTTALTFPPPAATPCPGKAGGDTEQLSQEGNMRSVLSLWACMLTCLIPFRSEATVVSLNSMVLAADVFTRGQYDDAQLGTWNGQPLSPTNHPTVDEDQLSADWNFYVNPNAKN